MDQRDKVNVLLAEYSTLRQEIVERIGHGVQIGAATLVALALLLGAIDHVFWPWLLIGSGIVVLGFAFYWRGTVHGIWVVARRVRELEHEINSRCGEHLLVWETVSGAGAVGVLNSVFRDVPPTDRSHLPPLDSYSSDD